MRSGGKEARRDAANCLTGAMTPAPNSSSIRDVLRESRREAGLTAACWIAACVYTVGYCAATAYRPEPPRLLAGIPEWVVWGVLAPWAVCTAFTLAYALRGMKDQPLVDSPEAEGTADG